MEIQRADRRLRFLAALMLMAAVAVGAVALLLLQGWLAELKQLAFVDAQPRLLAAFAWISGSACIMLLALGIHVWRVGARVRAAAQFPPPGARVLRDTVVLRGVAAIRRGRFIQGAGVVLMLCVPALLAASWRLYSVLATHAA